MVHISTFKSRAGSLRMTQQPNGSLISMPQARSIPGIPGIAPGRMLGLRYDTMGRL